MIPSLVWSRLLFALSLGYLCPNILPKPEVDANLTSIQPYAQDLVDRYHIPGLGIAAVRRPSWGSNEAGLAQFQANFGVSKTNGTPVTDNSLFSIASNSKLFTYFAIGLLVGNGTTLADGTKLGWQTKVKDILPGWQLQDQWASDHIDITDLLSHRSGMPAHDNAYNTHDSPADVIKRMAHLRPTYELRQQWQYNNQAYIVLSQIVSTLAGKEFHEYVNDNILAPLGMPSTTYNATAAAETTRRTHGFIRSNRNETACAEWWTSKRITDANGTIDKSCLGVNKGFDWWTDTDALVEAGAGGVITTTSDMLNWLEQLVKPTKLSADLLKRASTAVEVMQGDYSSPSTSIIGYGLAQLSWTYRGINLVGHTGALPGQRSMLVRIPDYHAAFFVWTSDEILGASLLKVIAYRMVESITGLPSVDIEEEILGPVFARLPKYEDIPKDPEPAPSPDNIVGTYLDMGYGQIKLSRPDSADSWHNTILGRVAVEKVPLDVSGPIYVASFDKGVISFLIFTHFSGDVFNWTAVATWPEISDNSQPTGESLSLIDDVGSAVLDGQGVGLYGNFWGSAGDAATGHAQLDWDSPTKRKMANVWFDKTREGDQH